MLLVLAEPGDELAQRLVAATADTVETMWLTPHDLVAARWEHRLTTAPGSGGVGAAAESRVYHRGRWRDLRRVSATLNRLRVSPPPAAGFSSDADREYAVAERHALLLSVLAALPGMVVNRPVAPSLAGADLTLAGWLALAASVSLPVRATVLSTDARRHPRPGWSACWWPAADPLPPGLPPGPRPAIWLAPVSTPHRCWVVGDAVVPADATAGRLVDEIDVARLARAGGCALLEVGLARDEAGRIVVVAADPFPVDAPEQVLRALARTLLPSVAVPR